MLAMKILFINEFGQNEVVEMQHAPRIGDNVPVFGYKPIPTVKTATWLPSRINSEIPKDIDLVITV